MARDNPEFALRVLRRLVVALTGVMLLAVILITGLLVIRLTAKPVPLPDEIRLPEGESVVAVTYGAGWVGVVDSAGVFHLFDATTGQLRQSVRLDLPER